MNTAALQQHVVGCEGDVDFIVATLGIEELVFTSFGSLEILCGMVCWRKVLRVCRFVCSIQQKPWLIASSIETRSGLMWPSKLWGNADGNGGNHG